MHRTTTLTTNNSASGQTGQPQTLLSTCPPPGIILLTKEKTPTSFLLTLREHSTVWHHCFITKLNSLGVRGHLFLLLLDYLRGRYFRGLVNGHTWEEHSICVSVAQGSVLGPLFWNAYFNYLLQLIPKAHASADDCTLTFPCDSSDHRITVTSLQSKHR